LEKNAAIQITSVWKVSAQIVLAWGDPSFYNKNLPENTNYFYNSLHQVNQVQVENFRFKIDITFILVNFFE
jgi:hypothetical protein